MSNLQDLLNGRVQQLKKEPTHATSKACLVESQLNSASVSLTHNQLVSQAGCCLTGPKKQSGLLSACKHVLHTQLTGVAITQVSRLGFTATSCLSKRSAPQIDYPESNTERRSPQLSHSTLHLTTGSSSHL